MTKTIPTDKARQGQRGRHVLIILVAALLLAMVVWGVVGVLWARRSTPDQPAAVDHERRGCSAGYGSRFNRPRSSSSGGGTSTFSTFL